MKRILMATIVALTAFIHIETYAQDFRIEPLPYGNMDTWMVREIKESRVIGGKTRSLYEIASRQDTLRGNQAYKNQNSPWATSSVYAHTKGITKGIVCVYPEKRGGGYAARLETRVEKIKVLGILNINVLISGAIFLGEIAEPVSDTDNPYSKLNMGYTFSRKPEFLQFDYRVFTGGEKRRINGLSATGEALGEKDMAEVHLLLQKRWEDAEGNIYALRLGTGWERFAQSVDSWQNQHRLKVHYGDITGKGYYREYMGLRTGQDSYYAMNSRGKLVPIIEKGWGDKSDEATHLIVQFSSSNGGPFTGSPNSKLWVDNIALGYLNE